MQKITLRPDQAALFKSQADTLDGIAEGFALGIQQAKKALLQAVLSIPDPSQQEAAKDGTSDAT